MNPVRRTTAAASTAVVLATAGGLLTAAAAPASAATTCTSPVYKRQFFANNTLSGTPKKTDCDSKIDQNWGTGAPTSGLPKNNFGVRWTVTRDFGSGGPFRLSASAQDGIRVYLDGKPQINLWKNVSSTVKKSVDVTIPNDGKKHTLRVDFVNFTGAANVKFDYTPRTSADVDKVKPLAPTGASVSYDRTTGKSKLTWAKNKEMDLAGYRVYRRTPYEPFSTPLATTTATSYTDITPPTGITYYYEVRAFDKAGNESAGSADQSVTPVDTTAPTTPKWVETSPYEKHVGISWTPYSPNDGDWYKVFRATSPDGPFTRIANVTDGLFYGDTSAAEDTVYYYRVTALDAAGNESAPTYAVKGQRLDVTPPSAVTGVTATPTEYGFEVRWDANPTADLKSYLVRRGELLGDEEEKVCSLYPGFHVSADTTSYAYTTVPDGEESCFIVDAIDDAGNSSFKATGDAQVVVATELNLTPSVETPEGSPLTLNAAGGDEGNKLEWFGQDESAGGFRVYRWNPASSTYEKLADVAPGVFQYVDTGAGRGTTSYYWVTAVAADGTESLPAGDSVVTAPTV
ncbi:fibronectin type III domain-containing protein [Streptomyces fulvoviolaceus]|uniref:fibronectin type III domain-containing protein n=1 Tax=Streptomyces fulvoviolaceus TaxID=285535 RepID=UPI0004C9E50A|nr:PA14 domain-containing protein [Streptomyces fulvoviolaceus]MCT9078942.1 PA14 domain-containing protein [Streptomyces fulvoviolaceus]